MNNNTTIEKLRQMRLLGMAEAHYGNMQLSNSQEYTIDQYLAMLVDQEWDYRQERKIANLKSRAKFKVQASIRDVDYSHPRELDRNLFERLETLDFIKRSENVIFTGAIPYRLIDHYYSCFDLFIFPLNSISLT